jgi:hypothetical protein
VLLLLAAAAADAPRELHRDERMNFRIVGALPAGWTRDDGALAFSYAIEEIPHAHVRITAARADRPKDPAALLARRAPSYRFPGASPEGDRAVREDRWDGQEAWVFEHHATARGVRCVRRVTAMWAKGVWYERIETLFGDVEEDEGFRKGAAVLREGFKLLAPPLPAPTPEIERFEDAVSGWRLEKPEGWLRVETPHDPGLRLAFERAGVLVRLFDYGLRESRFDLKLWMDEHFRKFQTETVGATRAALEAPRIEGAECLAERHSGTRDGRALHAHVTLIRAGSGALLALRASTHGGGPAAADEAAAAFAKRLRLSR